MDPYNQPHQAEQTLARDFQSWGASVLKLWYGTLGAILSTGGLAAYTATGRSLSVRIVVTIGMIALALAMFTVWRDERQRAQASQGELDALKAKRADRNQLGRFLDDLEHLRGQIEWKQPADVRDSDLIKKAGVKIAEICVYLKDNIGTAEAALFINQAERIDTPTSNPILIAEMKDAVRKRQQVLDALRTHVIQLKRIIERV